MTDLTTIKLENKKASMSIFGPNAFPVVTRGKVEDKFGGGEAYVAAGHYGKVIL